VHMMASAMLLDRVIRIEKQHGGVDLAAAADGSYFSSTGKVGRGALCHDGRTLGGRIEDEVRAGKVDNYLAEMIARIDILDYARHQVKGCGEGKGVVLIILDATSPVWASKKFREAHMRARARYLGDLELATVLVLEDEYEKVIYVWQKSHIGTVVEMAVDGLAKSAASQKECVAVPEMIPGHVSVCLWAAKSERALAESSIGLLIMTKFLKRSLETLRMKGLQLDALCQREVAPAIRTTIHLLRSDRFGFMASKAERNEGGVRSVGRALWATPCICGKMCQTREHALWECPAVADKRSWVAEWMDENQEAMNGGAAPHSQWKRTRDALRSLGAGSPETLKERTACLLGLIDSSPAQGKKLLAIQGELMYRVANMAKELLRLSAATRQKVIDGVVARNAMRATFYRMREVQVAQGPTGYAGARKVKEVAEARQLVRSLVHCEGLEVSGPAQRRAVVSARKVTRALAEDLCRWRLTATLQRLAREREIKWLPEEVQLAETRADAVRRWSRAEVFYTWMKDVAARRGALEAAKGEEVKMRAADAWVEVAKAALLAATRAKRDLHRCSALADCPRSRRGRAKQSMEPRPKKSKSSGKRSKALTPEGVTIASQRRSRAKRKFEAQEVEPLKGLLVGVDVPRRSRPRWMIPGSDSDDILVLQEGEVLAAAVVAQDNVSRTLEEEDEALTLDHLRQKGAANIPAGLHSRRDDGP